MAQFARTEEEAAAAIRAGRRVVRPDAIMCMEDCELWIKTACLACKRADVPLRRCAACQTAPYCSKECQRSHWPSHRDACGVLVHPFDFAWAVIVVGANLSLGFTHGTAGRPKSQATTVCPALNVICDYEGVPGVLLVSLINAETELTRQTLDAVSGLGLEFIPDAYNSNASLISNEGLTLQQVTPGLLLDNARRDPKFLTLREATLSREGKVVLELAKDLGIQAQVVVTPWGSSGNVAIPAHPTQVSDSKATAATKVKRIGEGHVKPRDGGDHLHRDVLAAPVLTPEALDPRNRASPLFFRRPLPARPYVPHSIEGRVTTDSHHPGPFFALPGDTLTSFMLCTALPAPSPKPLGLAPGSRAQFVEVNAKGDCTDSLGPEGWRWEPGRRAIMEERDRRFGVKTCGRNHDSHLFISMSAF